MGSKFGLNYAGYFFHQSLVDALKEVKFIFVNSVVENFFFYQFCSPLPCYETINLYTTRLYEYLFIPERYMAVLLCLC